MDQLESFDCHLLVADSAGINVWCAAGVCDFNEHKIADAVLSTDLATTVEHRRIILPPLAAAGIDLKKLKEECGFSGVWGPVHAEDIPAYIKAEYKTDKTMRLVRFSFKDRLINACGVFNVFLGIPFLLGWKNPRRRHFLLALNFYNIFGNFLLYPHIPAKHPANKSLLLGLLSLPAIFLYSLAKPAHRKDLPFYIFSAILINFLVSVDMIGSTPFFKTTIAHWLKTGNNQSLFQPEVTDACTKCGICERICPKGIFKINKEAKSITLDTKLECTECLACIKQCPHKAIRNQAGHSYKDDIKSIADLEQFMN
jgi:ferredoxin